MPRTRLDRITKDHFLNAIRHRIYQASKGALQLMQTDRSAVELGVHLVDARPTKPAPNEYGAFLVECMFAREGMPQGCAQWASSCKVYGGLMANTELFIPTLREETFLAEVAAEQARIHSQLVRRVRSHPLR
jgi:hypothetical protein